jgi:hypothetical protein
VLLRWAASSLSCCIEAIVVVTPVCLMMWSCEKGSRLLRIGPGSHVISWGFMVFILPVSADTGLHAEPPVLLHACSTRSTTSFYIVYMSAEVVHASGWPVHRHCNSGMWKVLADAVVAPRHCATRLVQYMP